MKKIILNNSSKKKKGFTLVEVSAAIGIASVGLVTVLALLAKAISMSSLSIEETKAATLAQRIFSDLKMPGITDTGADGGLFDRNFVSKANGDKDPNTAITFPVFPRANAANPNPSGHLVFYFDVQQNQIINTSESNFKVKYIVYVSGRDLDNNLTNNTPIDNKFSKVLVKVKPVGSNRYIPFYFIAKKS